MAFMPSNNILRKFNSCKAKLPQFFLASKLLIGMLCMQKNNKKWKYNLKKSEEHDPNSIGKVVIFM